MYEAVARNAVIYIKIHFKQIHVHAHTCKTTNITNDGIHYTRRVHGFCYSTIIHFAFLPVLESRHCLQTNNIAVYFIYLAVRLINKKSNAIIGKMYTLSCLALILQQSKLKKAPLWAQCHTH